MIVQPRLTEAQIRTKQEEARARAVGIKMVREAIAALSGPELIVAIRDGLSEHPAITSADLEILSNYLGRIAHEKARR